MECEQDGVGLVFVKYPVCHTLLEKISDVEQSDSIFCSLSKKYSVPVLDYYSSEITNDSTYYYNYTHLNKKGAERFTIMLCRDMDSLGVY